MRNHLNAQRPGVQNVEDAWGRLVPLLQGALRRKPAQFIAYYHLWHRCGGRAQTITIGAAELAASLGGLNAATARGWLDGLKLVGLVSFDDRDKRTGAYRVYVHEPEEPEHPKRFEGSPQSELFDVPGEAAPPDDGARVCLTKPSPDEGNRARVCLSKPSRESSVASAQMPLWSDDPPKSTGSGARVSSSKPSRPHMHGDLGETIQTLGCNKDLPVSRSLAAPPPEIKSRENESIADWLARGRDEKPADHALAAIAALPDRDAIKRRLILWAEKYRDPERPHLFLSDGRAGNIADHVVLDGLPESELIRIEATVDARVADPQQPLARNPMGLFSNWLEARLEELKIATRRKGRRSR